MRKVAAVLLGRTVLDQTLGWGAVLAAGVGSYFAVAENSVYRWPITGGAAIVMAALVLSWRAIEYASPKLKLLTGNGPPYVESYFGSEERPIAQTYFRVGVQKIGGPSIERARVTLDGERPILRDTPLEVQGDPGNSDLSLDDEPRYVDVASERYYRDGEHIDMRIHYARARTDGHYAINIGRQRQAFTLIAQAKDAPSERLSVEIFHDAETGRMNVTFSPEKK